MNLLERLFPKPTASETARQLGQIRIQRERNKIRSVVDEMRARHGLPKIEWPA